MASPIDGFYEWLCKKLQALDTDPEAFGDYIKGILDGDDSIDEKKEAIEGILGEIMEDDINSVAAEILQEWSRIERELHKERLKSKIFDIDQKLASIMEKQAQCVIKEKTITAEEKASRQALLVKYGQVSDGEDADDDLGEALATAPVTAASSNDLLVKNVNAELVALNQKEQRERAKADHEKKKTQDKLGREQQKQKAVERKDKEKKRTQKGERKR